MQEPKLCAAGWVVNRSGGRGQIVVFSVFLPNPDSAGAALGPSFSSTGGAAEPLPHQR